MGAIDGYLGKRVYLDTNFFIYTLENFAPTAAAVARLGHLIENSEIVAFTGQLTLAEVLVPAARSGDQRLFELYNDVLHSRDDLTVVPLVREDFVQAAVERANTGLKLPDALHLAVARRVACEAILTNDRDFAKARGIDILYLDDPALV